MYHLRTKPEKLFTTAAVSGAVFLIFGIVAVLTINSFLESRKYQLIAYVYKNFNLKIDFSEIKISSLSSIAVKELTIDNEAVYTEIPELYIHLKIKNLFSSRNRRNVIEYLLIKNANIQILKDPAGDSLLLRKNIPIERLPGINLLFDHAAISYKSNTVACEYISLNLSVDELKRIFYDIHLSEKSYHVSIQGNIGKYLEHFSAKMALRHVDTEIDTYEIIGKTAGSAVKMHVKSLNFPIVFTYESGTNGSEIYFSQKKVPMRYFKRFLTFTSNARFDTLKNYAEKTGLSLLADSATVHTSLIYKKNKENRSRINLKAEVAHSAQKERIDIRAQITHNEYILQAALKKKNLSAVLHAAKNEKFVFPQIQLRIKDIIVDENKNNFFVTLQNVRNGAELRILSGADSSSIYGMSIIKKNETYLQAETLPEYSSQFSLRALIDTEKISIHALTMQFRNFYTGVIAGILNLPVMKQYTLSGTLQADDNFNNLQINKLSLVNSINNSKVLGFSGSKLSNIITIRDLRPSFYNDTTKMHGTIDMHKTKNAISLSVTHDGTQSRITGSMLNRNSQYALQLNPCVYFSGLNFNYFVSKKNDWKLAVSALRINRNGTKADINAEGVTDPQFTGKGTVHIYDFTEPEKKSYLTISSEWDEKSILLNSIKYSDGENILNGNGEILLHPEIIYNVNLLGLRGDEKLSIQGSLAGHNVRAAAFADNFQVDKLPFPYTKYLVGTMRAYVSVSGNVFDPNLNAKLFINDFRFNSISYQFYGELFKYKQSWELKEFKLFQDIDKKRKHFVQVKNAVFANNKMSLKAQLNDFQLLWSLTGAADAEIDFDSKNAVFSIAEVVADGKKCDPFNTIINFTNNTLVFSSPTGNGLTGTVHTTPDNKKIDLRYMYNQSAYAVIKGKSGNTSSDIILTSDKFKFKYINLLNVIIMEDTGRSQTFDYAYGGTEYENINLFLIITAQKKGIIVNGQFRSSGKIRFDGMDEISEDYDITVKVENNVFTAIGPEPDAGIIDYKGCRVFLGGSINAGELTTIEEYDLTIRTSGEKGAPVKFTADALTIDGNLSDVDIQVKGSDFYPEITGRAKIINNNLTFAAVTTGEEMTMEQKRRFFFYRANWDVDISVGEKTRFSYPIIECFITPSSRIRFYGTVYNNDFYLSGTVESEKGTYTHAGIDFRLSRVHASFPADEFTIDPIVNLEASAKVRDPEINENITVYINKQSRLFAEEGMTYSASPPRSQESIKELLGFSQNIERPKERTDSEQAISASSRILANTMLIRPFERRIQRRLNLDLFRIDTDLMSIVNSQFNNPLGYAYEGFNTTFSFGKYFGNFIFFQSDLNLGNMGTDTNTVGGTIGLDYDFGLFNLETKFIMDDFSSPNNSGEFTFGIRRSIRF